MSGVRAFRVEGLGNPKRGDRCEASERFAWIESPLLGLQARCSFHTDSSVALEVTKMLFTFHFGSSPYGSHITTH